MSEEKKARTKDKTKFMLVTLVYAIWLDVQTTKGGWLNPDTIEPLYKVVGAGGILIEAHKDYIKLALFRQLDEELDDETGKLVHLTADTAVIPRSQIIFSKIVPLRIPVPKELGIDNA